MKYFNELYGCWSIESLIQSFMCLLHYYDIIWYESDFQISILTTVLLLVKRMCSIQLRKAGPNKIITSQLTQSQYFKTSTCGEIPQYNRAPVNAALATWSTFTRIRPIFWDLAVPYFIWLVVVKQSIDIREKNSLTSISFVFREMFNYSTFTRKNNI